MKQVYLEGPKCIRVILNREIDNHIMIWSANSKYFSENRVLNSSLQVYKTKVFETPPYFSARPMTPSVISSLLT